MAVFHIEQNQKLEPHLQPQLRACNDSSHCCLYASRALQVPHMAINDVARRGYDTLLQGRMAKATQPTLFGQTPCNLIKFWCSLFKKHRTIYQWFGIMLFFGPILKANQNRFPCSHKPIHFKILQQPARSIPSGWLSKTGFILTGEKMEWDDKGHLSVFLSCKIS